MGAVVVVEVDAMGVEVEAARGHTREASSCAPPLLVMGSVVDCFNDFVFVGRGGSS